MAAAVKIRFVSCMRGHEIECRSCLATVQFCRGSLSSAVNRLRASLLDTKHIFFNNRPENEQANLDCVAE